MHSPNNKWVPSQELGKWKSSGFGQCEVWPSHVSSAAPSCPAAVSEPTWCELWGTAAPVRALLLPSWYAHCFKYNHLFHQKINLDCEIAPTSEFRTAKQINIALFGLQVHKFALFPTFSPRIFEKFTYSIHELNIYVAYTFNLDKNNWVIFRPTNTLFLLIL